MIDREILIAPSILSGDFANMEKSVRQLEMWGGDLVHCDVMDGVYVDNITFGMPMVDAIRKITEKPLDVHLMITQPEKYVDRFASAGADIITFHPDASDNPEETLKKIKAKGKKCGIVFNPNVDIQLYSHLFAICDVVLVMTVFAGKGGQSLIPYCLERIKLVRAMLDERGLDIPVEADGGIGEGNIDAVVKSGASIIVAGNSVYRALNPGQTIRNMKKVTK